ncbi:Aldehyde dehydrogenase family protein [Thalassoglobus polymorphus]|uniref:Aldehyde dehydrogenase family protein n=2 Tax=Thalassoglobus polymorphus TaxID=2527994 RepID=A0A517QTS7_9PLAN|nr:Aldehyde dehydrogenase family protein [Thalassoglobus polymorphus]
MSTSAVDLQNAQSHEIDVFLSALRESSAGFSRVSIAEKKSAINEIRNALLINSPEWIELCSRAKSLTTSSQRSEEVLSGPMSTARYLTLLLQSLTAIETHGKPRLPGKISKLRDGRLKVPVFPANGIFDSIAYLGLTAEVWMKPGVDEESLHGDLLEPLLGTSEQPAPISLVLGAGNVASIPLTDSLSKLFQEGHLVLLKLNPVNDYLFDVYSKILAPVIERGWLRIFCGDAEAGKYAVEHGDVQHVHITGSHHTHDQIVWGATPEERQKRQEESDPALKKDITSELGNVTPWMIIPGKYSRKELQFQAGNLAASLTNNAAFNCITTRVIVTSKNWAQREEFLGILKETLAKIPSRVPYYPGTLDRLERFTGEPAIVDEEGTLPWKILENVHPEEMPQFFIDETFAPVCVEVQLDAETPEQFLDQAVVFCNEELFGTLAASITVTDQFQKQNPAQIEDAISRLNYGSVCINQWAGLVYALMTPPWGASCENDLYDVQSGIGSVHNLYFLDQFEKTVFRGPLCNFPKPVWFSSHNHSEQIAWKLVDLYCQPSVFKLPGLLGPALLG